MSDADLLKRSLLDVHPKWTYMLGFDFGFQDDTAFVVVAFSAHDPCMYFVETFKKPEMIAEDVALKLREFREKYRPVHMVGDCANTQFVETLRRTYRLALAPADKRGKEAHIAALNSDLKTKKARIIAETNAPLIEEWNALTWDEKRRAKGEFKELASKANHAADAGLYIHHFCRHYRATPEPAPDPASEMRKAAEERVRNAQEGADPARQAVQDFYDGPWL